MAGLLLRSNSGLIQRIVSEEQRHCDAAAVEKFRLHKIQDTLHYTGYLFNVPLIHFELLSANLNILENLSQLLSKNHLIKLSLFGHTNNI